MEKEGQAHKGARAWGGKGEARRTKSLPEERHEWRLEMRGKRGAHSPGKNRMVRKWVGGQEHRKELQKQERQSKGEVAEGQQVLIRFSVQTFLCAFSKVGARARGAQFECNPFGR